MAVTQVAAFRERMPISSELEGEFETHLTLSGCERGCGVVEDFAIKSGMKYLCIELARGMHMSQPMLTRRAHGTFSAQLHIAMKDSRVLGGLGIEVIRTKIEASVFNRDVPRTESRREQGRYFESHLRLLLAADADLGALASVAVEHGAHLSRNARHLREDCFEERFLTLRSAEGGYEEAVARTTEAASSLERLGYHLLDTEIEYVVYDSNLEVDAGWLPERER